jgi:hypothetical protein
LDFSRRAPFNSFITGEFIRPVEKENETVSFWAIFLTEFTELSELEHFQKNCSHVVEESEEAVFWGFGFVSAQLSRLVGTNLRLRQSR